MGNRQSRQAGSPAANAAKAGGGSSRPKFTGKGSPASLAELEQQVGRRLRLRVDDSRGAFLLPCLLTAGDSPLSPGAA